MTISEYEERFRAPAPSLHQAFSDMHGPNSTRRRRRRLWIAAAMLGLMTATMETALHRTVVSPNFPEASGGRSADARSNGECGCPLEHRSASLGLHLGSTHTEC